MKKIKASALENCKETNPRGSDRTGIACLREVIKEKEYEKNQSNQAFQLIMEQLLGNGLECSKVPVVSLSEGEVG